MMQSITFLFIWAGLEHNFYSSFFFFFFERKRPLQTNENKQTQTLNVIGVSPLITLIIKYILHSNLLSLYYYPYK